jgi:hypothetical protein
MKRGFAVSLILIIVLCAGGAFAGQPLGGPAEAEPGKIAFSAGYYYFKDKWTSNTLNDNFDPKVETNQYFGQLSYVLAPGWDVYLRAGAVDAKTTDSDFEFKDSGQFFGGIGIHGTFWERKDWHLKLGPIANFTYFSNWKDSATGPRGSIRLTVKDHYSFDVGFGFQYTPWPYLTIYGGPYFHFEKAELEATGNYRGSAYSDSSNIDTDKNFGPRLGFLIPITQDIALQFEGQYRSYASGGGWITFRF